MLALTIWIRNGSVEWPSRPSIDKNQKMLKKRQEKTVEEDRQSSKKMNACNALVDNNIIAWISCEQAIEKLKHISVEKRTAVVLAQIEF